MNVACLLGLVLLLLPSLALAQTGVLSGGSVTATGSTASSTLADRFAQRVNVRDYGAKCDDSTDDNAAFAAAINRVNTLFGSGVQAVVYVPSGVCLIKGTNGALPIFSGPGGVRGDGTHRSWIYIDSSYTGDLFSWSEAWMQSNYPQSTTVNIAASQAGPWVSGLTIVGNRSASAAQYALDFYDRDDFILVRDVDIFNIKGSCVRTGVEKNTTQAFIRESGFHNVRCFSSGDTGIPAWDFNAAGNGTGGTPVELTDINIYAPYGPGFVIRNNASGGDIRDYKISRLRVEGQENNPASVAADLVDIGDTVETGGVDNIKFDQMELASPYGGFCAFRMTAQNASAKPYNIGVKQSHISAGAGTGKGLCIDAGRDSSLSFSDITTTDTNVTIGSNTLVGTNITIDGNGREQSWTWSIDATSTKSMKSYLYIVGDRNGGAAAVTASYHDGSATGGNAAGSGAVDLQTSRGAATQVAANAFAVLAGGNSNTSNGSSGTVGGGFSNNVQGQYGAIPGGRQAADQGRTGIFAYASGAFVSQGDAQSIITVLRGSGSSTSAFRLTSDAGGANSANCLNLANNKAMGLRVLLHARDFTTAGTDYDWSLPAGMITRDASAVTTAVSIGTPVITTRGTTTGVSVSATADTTNGCLNLSFTPPSGNTDTWHAVARIDAVEVQ